MVVAYDFATEPILDRTCDLPKPLRMRVFSVLCRFVEAGVLWSLTGGKGIGFVSEQEESVSTV